ncbi:Pentatricopeptide repeat-containing-like protein [Gossypium australe]|uniref:Pentatricopeptide repeat-containing-like protein n=1 Tax=Gossypium australe TaxID=47621 RepID=A0A5B6VEL0_9ROSI|nr:Pentatricopeptide repeat-containing-like protein [Gossypium australe]
MKKRVDVFALSLYGVTPVPTILAETFRSLSASRREGEGRFIGCAQLFILQELLSVERVSSYPKSRQQFRRKMDGDSLESPRRRRRMESPSDDP